MPELELQSLIVLAVGVFLFAIILLLLVSRARRWLKANWARRQHELDLAEMRERWKRIERLLASPEHEGDRLAVIEADKLLDFVLRAMNLPGGDYARRSQFAQKKYFELKRVRWAHGLRNKLVHETDYRLKRAEAHAAVKEYERALKVLGAL